MSSKRKVIIGAIAILFAIVLAIVIPLRLSEKGEKRALALDLTSVVLPTATALTQPTGTPAVIATPIATPRSVPTPDHTPELPAWATRTATDSTKSSPRAIAFRNTITALGEVFYLAHTGEASFEDFAERVYDSFSSATLQDEKNKKCTREFFVPEYGRILREAAGPKIPSSQEDLQKLRDDLDRFYTEAVVLGISKDGTRAQVDTEISTFYLAIDEPFVWENDTWKLHPDVPLGCE